MCAEGRCPLKEMSAIERFHCNTKESYLQVASCEQALKTNRKQIQNHQSKTMLLFETYILEFEFDRHLKHMVKPSFHKANFDHDSNQVLVKTKQLEGRMTAQAHNRFVSCVVVVECAVNGNQAFTIRERRVSFPCFLLPYSGL